MERPNARQQPPSDGPGDRAERGAEDADAEMAPPASETSTSGEAPPRPDPTVVGIGASAGGLAALRTFFQHVPEDSGLAFVVVVHLSPEHESHLADLLQPHVKVPVGQVTETTKLEANRVYVIPPNRNLNTIDTHLRLSPLEERRRERAPIDHFFRTLAKTHDGHSVAVVLTGTGSDGTLGIKEIKEKGGLTVVQDPAEAEYDGMPQSAVSTGLVDLVLPLAEIPGAILRFARTEPRVPVLADDEDIEAALAAEQLRLLQKVFAQLRARTGRDFSRYKRSTILRRIQRRMQLRYVEELADYLELLREGPGEAHALADDLLITVTNFFRDTEVFEALENEVVPHLFEGKGPEDDVRVWSVGCATGEEAYSLAILLLEEAERREAEYGAAPRLQVFASDLHERSLERAREGFYPGDIATDVGTERLDRFFQKEDGGYRIKKEVREVVVFAPHNLLSDPPFSRVDLVACRNVLIYLQRGVQKDVVELFHYALRPDGWLVLGTSETVDSSDLFVVEDKKRCVYRKRNVPAPEVRLPVFPLTYRRLPWGGGQGERGDEYGGEPIAPGPLHQRLVEQVAPPSLLVSPDHKVVHLSEHAGRYLVPAGGEFTANVFKLVREELRIELRAALHQAQEQGIPARSKAVMVRFDGERRPVVVQVRPALEPRQEGYALVIFDEWEPTTDAAGRTTGSEGNGETTGGDSLGAGAATPREAEAELALTKQRLQAIIEEYETSQEELKASNEELQSSNEELRSTLEELETSKEELQSMNEELQTVNQENRHKVEELAQLTDDLQNHMAATEIATLFLDRDLRIMRYTPKVGELFNVRPADRGRPLSDITSRLGYDDLLSDAQAVLKSLVPVEREVEDEAGRWYLARVLPYRSQSDRIEGVVVTFVDITQRREAEEDLRRTNETLEARVEERTREVQEQEARVREVASRLTMAEQEERRRLAQILHDDLQQRLFAFQLRMDLIARAAEAGDVAEVAEYAREVHDWAGMAITTTRRLTVDLSPPVLKEEGLTEALGWLATQMEEVHGLHVEVRDGAGVRLPSEDMRVLLFHAVRELLFNVVKHAGADRAEVELRRADGHLAIAVHDEGCGFDSEAPPSSRGGFGLANMQERLHLFGGRTEVASTPGKGTRITLFVPVEHAPSAPGNSRLNSRTRTP